MALTRPDWRLRRTGIFIHIEKVDFTRFYECKDSQKERFIYDFFSGEYVIIMLKAKNAATNRVSEFPQNSKFKNTAQL